MDKKTMRPTRIFYIHHTFRNQSGSFLLWNIAKRLDRERFQIFAACLREGGPYETKLRDVGVEVVNFDLKTLIDIRVILRLAHYIKKHDIDIVETAVFPSDVYGRVSAKLANVPTVISTMHRMEDHKQETIYRILFWLDTLTIRLTTRLIAVSQAVKNYLISWHKVKPEKISVVHNGLDAKKYNINIDIDEFKRELGLGQESPTVAFIGRLVKFKGTNYFLQAATSIIRSGITVQFLVVGDGPLKSQLMRQTHLLGISEHVHFTGFREDVPQILTAIDILAVPSSWEGLPLVVLEGMHSGKAIVATRVGGIPEAIEDGETGILIPPRDADRLVDAITDLLKHPNRREEMGKKAKQIAAEKFDVDRMVKKYERIYVASKERQTKISV